jgi:hypothetical protein
MIPSRNRHELSSLNSHLNTNDCLMVKKSVLRSPTIIKRIYIRKTRKCDLCIKSYFWEPLDKTGFRCTMTSYDLLPIIILSYKQARQQSRESQVYLRAFPHTGEANDLNVLPYLSTYLLCFTPELRTYRKISSLGEVNSVMIHAQKLLPRLLFLAPCCLIVFPASESHTAWTHA